LWPIVWPILCLHIHGTAVGKPIPSYQVHKGDAFAMVDQAVDLVMLKVKRRVGSRPPRLFQQRETLSFHSSPEQLVPHETIRKSAEVERSIGIRRSICAAEVGLGRSLFHSIVNGLCSRPQHGERWCVAP
jgi:hypothetical protein